MVILGRNFFIFAGKPHFKGEIVADFRPKERSDEIGSAAKYGKLKIFKPGWR